VKYKFEDVIIESIADLENLTGAELVDLYNQAGTDLPQVKKFENKATAQKRTWERIEQLGRKCNFFLPEKPAKPAKPENPAKPEKPATGEKRERTPKAEKAEKSPRDLRTPESYGAVEVMPEGRKVRKVMAIAYRLLASQRGSTVADTMKNVNGAGGHLCRANIERMILRLGGRVVGKAEDGADVYRTDMKYTVEAAS
jgi:hypothetical protein